jgi:hypothetical protein
MESSWPFGYSTRLIFNTEIGEVIITIPTRFLRRVKEAIAEHERSAKPTERSLPGGN